MATRNPDSGPWPAVTDPAELLTAIADWLSGYGNPATRHTYAEGLGLPTSHTDLRDWLTTPDENWRTAVIRYAADLDTTGPRATGPGAAGPHVTEPRTAGSPAGEPGAAGPHTGGPHTGEPRAAGKRTPPPAGRGRFRNLHWLRWSANHGTAPRAVTTQHVKAWLRALDEAGAAVATRDRMLATVKALYTHLADVGIAGGNPAALNRRRLGLVKPTGSTSSTIVLTTAQVRALLDAAAKPRQGAGPRDTARA